MVAILQPSMFIVVGLVVTVAPTAGLVLGGYLTEAFSWKALFHILSLAFLLALLLMPLVQKVTTAAGENTGRH